MFKYLKDHSADVIAIMVTGKLEKADYESLIPEIEEKISRYGKVNLYWEMADFEGWQPSGLWQDLTFDIKHANDFNKIALVGDKKWEKQLIKLIKPFTSAAVSYFDISQCKQAQEWVKDKTSNWEKAL